MSGRPEKPAVDSARRHEPERVRRVRPPTYYGWRLLEHFARGGTLDDTITVGLYHEAHGLASNAKIDPDDVARWALCAATRIPL